MKLVLPDSIHDSAKKQIAEIYNNMTAPLRDTHKPLLIVFDQDSSIAKARDALSRHLGKMHGPTIRKEAERLAGIHKDKDIAKYERELYGASLYEFMGQAIGGGGGIAFPGLNMAFVSNTVPAAGAIAAHEIGHLNTNILATLLPQVASPIPLGLALSGIGALLARSPIAVPLGIAAILTAPLALAPLISEGLATAKAKKHLSSKEDKEALDRAMATYRDAGIKMGALAAGAGLVPALAPYVGGPGEKLGAILPKASKTIGGVLPKIKKLIRK